MCGIARNQLAQIKQSTSVIASFSHDPLGRRVDTNLNRATAGYLYDGLNAVQETHGSTATSILSGLTVDECFARTDTSGRTDFLTDALNGTIGLTSNSGALVEQYTYDPYGNTTARSSAFNNPSQYTGRENTMAPGRTTTALATTHQSKGALSARIRWGLRVGRTSAHM